MARHPAMIAHVLFLVAACGGGDKKVAKEPVAEEQVEAPPAKETEADRAKKRLAAAKEIVPEGSACLPPSLKDEGAPRLELAAVGKDAIVCAIDTNEERLLGPVGCWKINLLTGALDYQEPAPLPGHGFSVTTVEGCARGYCLPKDAKGSGTTAHVAWNADGSKVAVLVGDEVHIFDAGSKAHEKSFSIRGDKGVTNNPRAVHWVADTMFIEGADDGPFSAVWAFKADGTPVGAIEAIGSKDGKPLSTFGGSFSLLDKNRVAVAEQGFSTMTIYDVSTGARAKLVRKLVKPPCKPAELTAYWQQNEGVGAKCKAHMEKQFGHLVGATAVAGSKSLLVLLRGSRTGELGVFDAKTLAEKSVIKMPWCEGGGGGGAASADDDQEADAPAKTDTPKSSKRAPVKKSEDPDAGGE